MAVKNPFIDSLSASYLFVKIAEKQKKLLLENPQADIISLGIGDTTLPLPASITTTLSQYTTTLSTPEGYRGYGDLQGSFALRQKISQIIYENRISPEEIFLSDGSKPDIGRLQLLFSPDTHIAVQDPAYPVYLSSSTLTGKHKPITLLPCTPENDFFPTLQPCDLLFFCSPNNPTGTTASYDQLQQLISFAQQNQTLIIFDSAYSSFIQDNSPTSIYNLPESQSVAIESGSFSKSAGFTGIRLGWTVVPNALRFKDGTPVIKAWKQIVANLYNGPSVLAENAALAALSFEGQSETQQQIAIYLENAKTLKQAVIEKGYTCYGGENSPYLWVHTKDKTGEELADHLLNKAHLVTIPGAGFGPSGKHFIRLSAFGDPDRIKQAATRLKEI